MPVHRCTHCSIPYVDAEVQNGVCPGCHAPLAAPVAPPRDIPTPAPTASAVPRRALPFLLGLLTGCLIGPAALWAALLLGLSVPGAARPETLEAPPAQKAQKPAAEEQAREPGADGPAAEAQHAEAAKALDAANQKVAAVQKQKDEAEQRLKDALARLGEEQGRRATLEKTLAEGKRAVPTPTLSFVHDWQMLGPFASTDEQGHDTVYPPEREPVQLDKAYDGFGGPVKWRPYHSAEDKIDLAAFFQYREAGAAYAFSWVYSDGAQAVTLGVGSDDGVRLWVNGEKVDDVKGGRQARPGQDVVKAHLREGWNEILAKVDNITGTWELYLEFRTEDGGRPLKMFSTSSPPRASPK